jgi:hypothetical protein
LLYGEFPSEISPHDTMKWIHVIETNVKIPVVISGVTAFMAKYGEV